MRVACIGGGPAGLYLGILLARADPAHEVVVYERNRADDTFGFGVVFSDATLGNLEAADAESLAAIRSSFAHWDAIDTHVGGEVIRSVGHGFCGLERKELLLILQRRCRELGVELRFEVAMSREDIAAIAAEVDLLVGADGLTSAVRELCADEFGPTIDHRPNRFAWFGTTVPYQAFTFYFKPSDAGLWRVHAYRYSETGSTFIPECTEETFAATGLDPGDEDGTIAYLEALFADELAGHSLIKNRSMWRQFPTVSNRRWYAGNTVLVGDAAHTAHFSIGSGTKLAMEDCIALTDALRGASTREDIAQALISYDSERRPPVTRLQAAAQVSLEWFEDTERYIGASPIAFTYSLMTRSLRVTHDNLLLRDRELAERAQTEFAGAPGVRAHDVPFDLYGERLGNRVVCDDGHQLILAGGRAVPVIDAEGDGAGGEQITAVRLRADDVLAMPVAERATWLSRHQRVIAIVCASGEIGAALGDDADGRDAQRAVARAADSIRSRCQIPVVASLPGVNASFLDTLLLAGRADLGVL